MSIGNFWGLFLSPINSDGVADFYMRCTIKQTVQFAVIAGSNHGAYVAVYITAVRMLLTLVNDDVPNTSEIQGRHSFLSHFNYLFRLIYCICIITYFVRFVKGFFTFFFEPAQDRSLTPLAPISTREGHSA